MLLRAHDTCIIIIMNKTNMAEALAARQRHYKTLYAKIVAHIYNDSEITDYGDSDIDEIYNNFFTIMKKR